MTQSEHCDHKETFRGKDIPRRYGSYRSEVCQQCGSFRPLTHHDDAVGPWEPAEKYEPATTPYEDE